MPNQVGGHSDSRGTDVDMDYETPSLTWLGNARELLAGNSGSVPDGGLPPPIDTRPSG